MKEFQTFACGEELSAFSALHDPTGIVATSGGLLDRAHFFALLGVAISVAEPGSAPTLMLIALNWTNAAGFDAAPDQQVVFANAAASGVAEVLGSGGFVGVLRGGRLAVLMASDGRETELGAAVMECLARPITCDGVTAIVGAVIGAARWGTDGATAEELFVAADRRIHAAGWQPVSLPKNGAGVRFVKG